MDALGGALMAVGPPTSHSEKEGPDSTSSSDSSSTCESDFSPTGGGDGTFTAACNGTCTTSAIRVDGLEAASTEQWDLADRVQQERLWQQQQGEMAVLADVARMSGGTTRWPRRSAGWLTLLQAAQVRLLIAALPYAHFQRSSTARPPEPEPEPRPTLLLLRDLDVAESVGLLIVGRPPLCFTRAHWAIHIGAVGAVHPWRKSHGSGGHDDASPIKMGRESCAGSPVAAMRDECAGTTGATAMVDEIMFAGVHFAEFQLHSGSQMTFGVVLPTYEPPDADLPSEPDAQEREDGINGDWRQGGSDHTLTASDSEQGWVVEADTGDAMHDGQYCEWETGTPVGFSAGDTVGLLLQLASSSNGRSTGCLTLYKNGQRRGVPFDGLHSDDGFSWAVELCDCGDCVSILRRPPPLGPTGSPLQHYTFENDTCGSTASPCTDDICSSQRGQGRTMLQQLQDAPFEAVSEHAVEALRGRQPHAEHHLVRHPRPV
eukprot:COSAG02_NODE_12_length_58022_cov_242.077379_13_plen_487_part_00